MVKAHRLLPAALAIVLLNAMASRISFARDADFGLQWVRSHPLTIMGVCQIEQTFDVDEYKAAGMNHLLAWKPRKGLLGPAQQAELPHFIHLYGKEGVTDEFTSRVKQIQSDYPTAAGIIVNDEPSLKAMPLTHDVLEWLRETYPDALVLSNAFPVGGSTKDYAGEEKHGYGYSEYIGDFASIVKPDVLMFDIYPFGEDGGSGVSSEYYMNLAMVRQQGLKNHIPYWTFIQTYQTNNRRLPSESDLRMQIFSSLTYGFTGIAYFTYDVAFDRGLLEKDGEPNDAYRHAAKVNHEVANVGKALRCLTSTDVSFIPTSSEMKIPHLNKAWKANDGGDGMIKAIAIADDAAGLGQGGLIGFFRDDKGQKYFMLTNLNQHSNKSADECRATFTIKFEPGLKKILKLNRQTGQVETVSIDNPTNGLTIDLEGGTGDLFKYDTGGFAGVE